MALLAFALDPEDFSSHVASVTSTSVTYGTKIRLLYTQGAFGVLDFRTPAAEFWSTFILEGNASNIHSGLSWFHFIGGGVNLFRLTSISASSIALEAWNGTDWVTLQTSASGLGITSSPKVECYVNMAGAGTFIFRLNGVEIINYSGNLVLTAQTTIDQLRLDEMYASTVSPNLHNFIVADEDCWDWMLHEDVVNSDGSPLQWEGLRTDIDDFRGSGYSEVTFINSATIGQTSIFGSSNLDSGYQTGHEVVEVLVRANARKIGDLSQLLGLVMQDGSLVEYEQASVDTVARSFSKADGRWALNPETGLAWTVPEIQAFKIGVTVLAA